MATIAARTLLLVDDEPAQVRLISAVAGRAGWRVLSVPDGARALATVAQGPDPIDAVLIDIWRPAEGGAALVATMRTRWPRLPIVMVTAQPSIGLAVEAMRAGANDFLLKPIATERLMAALDAAAANDPAQRELRPLAEKVSAPLGFDEIVGSAPPFRAALAAAAKAARGRAPVLVEGPPGSGKELIARAIHGASSRGRRAMTVVRCDALSPTMTASDLFGHERDAFPGAFQASPGRAVLADGGTLFLTCPTALNADAQARLLGLIEEGQVTPVGGRTLRLVDVRVIAASSRALAPMVAAGDFRADLADRLCGVTIRVPALAERPGDIPALTRHLLARIGRAPGMSRLGVTDEALSLLAAHPWPGNVRQLHDTLFRAALEACGPALTPADFPEVAQDTAIPHGADGRITSAAGVQLFQDDGHLRPLAQIEADLIRLAIGHYGGRMSEVARRLGIGRSTLYRKLVELGLDTAA